ncbi:glycoside hydrolase family 6 protein [Nocardioides zeae]|uniref:Glucanase n=1 Tax=Nocardioides imazamoxiresistens TaxID=3231893 RepID=A0ABU3PU52_9ACTN|nr:glycoside hydrolase family 6 protein [Nocardioides zeae]MDT9592709.1 glycoside hydrolase family 6 protein [Nocardioides zeae]
MAKRNDEVGDERDGRRPELSGHRHLPGHVRRADPAVVEAVNRQGQTARPGPTDREVAAARDTQRRRRRRWWALGTVLALVASAVIAWTVLDGPLTGRLPWSDAQADNPFAGRGLYVQDGTQAADASADAAATGRSGDAALLDRLADVPTSIWLTPEALGQGRVGSYVRPIAEDAAASGEVAVFVVYGVTDRDCQSAESAGGLPPEEYASWVGEIASAMAAGNGRAVAVLEPDGLASTFDCPGIAAERVRLLAGAVGSLVDANVPTYVDAGHSDWRSVEDMAGLLRQVGVERVRGFSTNVAAYQSDADEREYAESLTAALGGEAHYVVDTGRNGGADRPGSQWCNPVPVGPFGADPGAVEDGSHQDARLWIKPPGESDGSGAECAGGPAAGSFWAERALAMAAASGWG